MANLDYVLTLIEDASPADVADLCVQALTALKKGLSPVFKPGSNQVVGGTLEALAEGDCTVRNTVLDVRNQLFAPTASGNYLNQRGADVGVRRPPGVGMHDVDYRNLIPVMSYVPKQLRLAIHGLLEVWYGPLAVRANVIAGNPEPYPLSDGLTLEIEDAEGETFTFVINENDYEDVGEATSQELADAFNKQVHRFNYLLEARVEKNALTFLNHLNISAKAIGPAGNLQVIGGTAAVPFSFDDSKITINSRTPAAVAYEVINDEIVVLLPSSPAVVSRGLRGACHLNEDATGTIRNGYIFDRRARYSISGLVANTLSSISSGTVLTNILVDEVPAAWPNEPGYFLVDFGLETEEGPIRYLTVPNNANLVIDPSYVFTRNHAAGAPLNFVRGLGPPTIDADGSDYAAYVTGTAIARLALRDLIVAATAVGVVVRFVVLTPEYRWSNPSLDTNEAV